MTGGRKNVFLFVVWAKARPFEDEIRETLARDFKILLETEMFWPYWHFTRKLREFYGFGSRFTWWNKARKCGRGPFKVFLVEDLHPEFKSEIDTRGQRLLVDDRVYRDKKSFRLLTRHSNLVHSSVTAEETDVQMKALFGCGVEVFLSLSSDDLRFLGAGSRRACYEVPGTDLCLKCYRDEAGAAGAVAREIRKFRHDEKHNTCCQEYRYHQELKRRLPDYVFAAFPERLEQVYLPARGWCLLESRVRNADGTPCGRFSETYRAADKATKSKLLKQFWLLVNAFAAYAVRFYDPQNVLVQHLSDGTFRLRVVDFEPASRTLFPIDSLCPAIRRRKVIRRAERYLRTHCGGVAEFNGLNARIRRKWDNLMAAEGAAMGLADCVPFLENKMLNDVFYRGTFKGAPCVVKCSSRAPDTIANEANVLRRLNKIEPSFFPKVFAFSDFDGCAVLVMEEINGRSLEERLSGRFPSERADSHAHDLVRIFRALQSAGVVHRDIVFSNLLEGADGRLRLIDFQLAVDRNAYREMAWARRDPVYLYVIFGMPRTLPLGEWNDAESAISILKAFPQTPVVVARTRELEGLASAARFAARVPWKARLRLGAYRLSLILQLAFSRKESEKRHRLEWRYARFANGRKK